MIIDRVRGLALNFSWGLLLPIFLRLADVGLVAELGHLLSLGERLRVGGLRSGMELLGLVGISLLDREVANLAQILLDHLGYCVVVGVASLAVGEERLGGLSSHLGHGDAAPQMATPGADIATERLYELGQVA